LSARKIAVAADVSRIVLVFGTTWHRMSYEAFLKARRTLIAQTIRQAYEKLAGKIKTHPTAVSVADLIASGETGAIEFKSTLRTNLHTGEKDPRMEMAVLKSVARFLDAKGGTLIVGVTDDGAPVGLKKDGFVDEDKMSLHLINLLRDRIGAQHAMDVQPHFDDLNGTRVLVVDCSRSPSPVFVKDGLAEKFFVRYGPSTLELTGSTAQEYIKNRF
jgi:predicted HTH transcriptional regulator